MEQEIHTRWAFPGAFAAGTFLWLAYVFGNPYLAELQGNWLAAIVVLLTGVPVIGFLAGTAVYWIVGGYHGKWFFRWGDGSEARSHIARWYAVTATIHDEQTRRRLLRMDEDVLASLAAFGGAESAGGHEMPERLQTNGRRRWTACWAAWNSAVAIAFGCGAYLAYYLLSDRYWDRGHMWPWAALPLVALFVVLPVVGWRARKDVWHLELGWALLAYPLARRDDADGAQPPGGRDDG